MNILKIIAVILLCLSPSIFFTSHVRASPSGQTTWDGSGLWSMNNVNPSTVSFLSNTVARFTNFQFSWPPAVSLIGNSQWIVNQRVTLLERLRAWNFTDVNGGFAWQTALDWGAGSAVMGYGRSDPHTPNTGILVGGECTENAAGSTLSSQNLLGQWLTANITLDGVGQKMYFSISDAAGTVIGQTSSPGYCGTMFSTLPVHVIFFVSFGEVDADWITVRDATGASLMTDDFLNGQPRIPGQTCVSVPPGLVSWWTGDGNAKDARGQNDGVLENNASFTTGEVGQSFSLNGLNQYVLVGDPSNLKITSGITLDAWVNPAMAPPIDDGSLSGIYAVTTKWGQSSITDAYGIWLHNPDGNIRLVGGIGVPGVGDNGIRNGGVIPTGLWTYIAMTYNGTTGANILYVNGIQVGERSRPGGITSSDLNVLIGKEDSGLPRYFNGAIDEVEIYNRPLAQPEIQSLFDAGANGKCKTSHAIQLSELFTDSNLIPLPRDLDGNPTIDVVLSNGKVRSVNPGQVLAISNITNIGNVPLQSLTLNNSLPADWTVHPSWLPAMGGITAFVEFPNGTRLDITNKTTITVSTGNPEMVSLSISNMTATLAGQALGPGEGILLAAKLSYGLIGTSESVTSYPRNYTDTSSASAWMNSTFSGGRALASGSASFTANAKVNGDVNGDGVVNLQDASMIAYAFGAKPGDARWDPALDVLNQGIINLQDVSYVYFNYGNHA